MLHELTTLMHKDSDAEKVSEKVAAIIEKHGGKVSSIECQGTKRLAYEIAGQNMATYYFYTLELPKEASAEIYRQLNVMDEVMRYLLVSVDTRKFNQ